MSTKLSPGELLPGETAEGEMPALPQLTTCPHCGKHRRCTTADPRGYEELLCSECPSVIAAAEVARLAKLGEAVKCAPKDPGTFTTKVTREGGEGYGGGRFVPDDRDTDA